jgi:hypothetical protein
MYGMGETAKVYSLFPTVFYVIEREYDGFKKVVDQTSDYEDAVKKARVEGMSNSASYYAKVRIENTNVVIWEEDYSPGWRSDHKGD